MFLKDRITPMLRHPCQESPQSLKEVTLVSEPTELRQLEKFLEGVAADIDKHGSDCEHVHFSDFLAEQQEPELIVFNAKAV
ncbi:hypothetical protein [Corallincola holothuriorum]|uniref:hypothetical protein n=1 Tax=Corallincola holothuriorum TaxID=2282215 RepID=UPI0011C035CE|nr:hypothetical protein [Corallincola holothuriorum]